MTLKICQTDECRVDSKAHSGCISIKLETTTGTMYGFQGTSAKQPNSIRYYRTLLTKKVWLMEAVYRYFL